VLQAYRKKTLISICVYNLKHLCSRGAHCANYTVMRNLVNLMEMNSHRDRSGLVRLHPTCRLNDHVQSKLLQNQNLYAVGWTDPRALDFPKFCVPHAEGIDTMLLHRRLHCGAASYLHGLAMWKVKPQACLIFPLIATSNSQRLTLRQIDQRVLTIGYIQYKSIDGIQLPSFLLLVMVLKKRASRTWVFHSRFTKNGT